MRIRRSHIWISGRVQGVFFRASAQDEARRLGIKGSVKNLMDGRVEIVAEGEEKAMKEFVEWCRHGPRLALVSNIKVKWEDARGNFKDFEILY